MTTLDLLRNSRVNLDLSAYAYLLGPYNLNKSPMSPTGNCVIVHNKPGRRTSWGNCGTNGWYIGPSLDHYRCIQCYMPATGIVWIIETLQYIPKPFYFLKTTTKYYLQQAIEYIIAIMKDPQRHFLSCTMEIQQKKSIIFPTSGKEAHLSPACKIFHYPQCYHRVRMKIFNTKISSAHQYQLWEWNRFGNLWGCKHKIKHTPQLQESSLQHPPDWIHIQIHGFKICKI